MTLSYRKKIEITPDISLNVTKKGISTSFGVRETSITAEKNGTYFNTGIPGTGIYSKKKTGGRKAKNASPPNSTKTKANTSEAIQGCLILLSIAAIIGLFFFNITAGLVGFTIFFIITAILANSSKKKKVEQFIQSKIDLAKAAIEQATNPIQKTILQSFVSCVELSKKADEKEAIINALQTKLAKKENIILQEQLIQYEAELSNLYKELEKVQFDADKNLSDIEKQQFSKLCDSFENLLECQKTWIITSSNKSTELKFPDSSSVNREVITFDTGVFNYIKSNFDIPMLRDNTGIIYYIYPQFIIKAVSFCDFQIIPKETINIDYSNQHFIEKKKYPSDSEIISYTYQHVDKDGGPDKQFSNNPRYPILIYGKLDISPLDLSFYFSNTKLANLFANALKKYKNISFNENNDETPIFPTTNEITESYFNSINDVVENLVTLFEKLKKDKDFQAAVTSGVKMKLNINGKKCTDFSEQLRIMLLTDLMECYIELNHPIDLNSKEGLGLLLLLARTGGFNKITFSTLNIAVNQSVVILGKNYINQLKDIILSKSTPKVEDKLIISKVLHEYNPDIQKQYLILLYRFISITAKADETVTEAEQKWLNELMKHGAIDDKTPSMEKTNDNDDLSGIALSLIGSLFEGAARLIAENQQSSTSSK